MTDQPPDNMTDQQSDDEPVIVDQPSALNTLPEIVESLQEATEKCLAELDTFKSGGSDYFIDSDDDPGGEFSNEDPPGAEVYWDSVQKKWLKDISKTLESQYGLVLVPKSELEEKEEGELIEDLGNKEDDRSELI